MIRLCWLLILFLSVAPAAAQTVICSTAAPGTSDSRCASTAFVQAAITITGNIPVGGTTGQSLVKLSNANFDTGWANSGGSGSISIGTTTVLGGTPGFILYNNGGVLGNQTFPGITSLTGDVTGTGPGATATTLATVNGNVGSFGSSTAIPNFTVNAKGLITAAGTSVVIAPAGTVTGTTLASNVVNSNLISAAGGTFGTFAYANVLTPPAIAIGGGATPNAAAFTTLNLSGLLTGAAATHTTIGATGNVTFSGLLTTGTIANSLCNDSSGHIIAQSGANCFSSGSITAPGSNSNVPYNSSGTLAANGGFNYDATSVISLGVSGTSVGGVKFNNATSGFIQLSPATGALGSAVVTIPDVTGTMTVLGNTTTGSGNIVLATAPTVSSLTVTSAFTATGLVTLGDIAPIATNTILANVTSGSASPTAVAVSGCSSASSALIWTTNTGPGCNTSITAAAVPASGLTGSTLASGVTASSLTSVGTLTALAVSGTANFTSTFQIGGNAMTFPGVASNLGFLVGSIVSGNCIQASGTAGGFTDAGAVCGSGGGGGGSTGNKKDFVAGTDFTAGTTTALTVAPTPVGQSYVLVYFDGVFQNQNTWCLSTATINFGTGASCVTPTAIPLYVKVVEIYWFSTAVAGTAAGSNTQVQYNSAGSLAANGGMVYDGTSILGLGVSGTSVGTVQLNNATSGSIKLIPTTGALGTQTATFPAKSGTVAFTSDVTASVALLYSYTQAMLGGI